MPVLRDGFPPAEWELSEEGRRTAGGLAKELALYPIGRMLSSVEPKARETARLVARMLDLELVEWLGLHEQDRANVDHLDSPEVFRAHVRELFDKPDQLVYGRETARAAQQRFALAVESAIAAHGVGDLAIVAHGTVIALFVALRTGVEPFDLWQRLGLPWMVVMTLPQCELLEIVEGVRPR